MTNSIKLIAGFVILVATFLVTPEVQAQGNAEKLPGVMEKNGTYLFTALKMSPADQAALMKLLKGNESSYSLTVNSERNVQSYGRLEGVNLKVKEIAGKKITTQVGATCYTLTHDNQCFNITTLVKLPTLSAANQAKVKSLVEKYL
ncbi:hypothetical protein [Haliscomenobacter sp.]|uniref:hypothetical protein n=1 Tax=Haliscomenobacter sp. TaxID=2717303 RepID=UPI0035945A43